MLLLSLTVSVLACLSILFGTKAMSQADFARHCNETLVFDSWSSRTWSALTNYGP
jgi:hypothetical protein